MYIHRARHIRKPKKGSKPKEGFRSPCEWMGGKFGWPPKEKVWSDKKDTGAAESLPAGTGFLLRVM